MGEHEDRGEGGRGGLNEMVDTETMHGKRGEGCGESEEGIVGEAFGTLAGVFGQIELWLIGGKGGGCRWDGRSGRLFGKGVVGVIRKRGCGGC